MRRPPVVVMGIDCATGLQTARRFHERGIEVIGIATDGHAPCARTRSCSRIVIADRDPESMAAALFRLGEQLGGRAVLVPCTDLAVLGVARHREALKRHFYTSVPSEAVIRQLMDKACFAEFAAHHDLPIPETHVIRNPADAARAARESRYPSVFKPSVKSPQWDDHAPGKTLVVESPAELLDAYERHARYAEAFIVQELVRGEDTQHFTCDGYFAANGEPLATFSARKLRQWPPVVGQGCLSVEFRNDEVRDQTIRLFKKAGHHGQGYVEAKWDPRTGRHVIIEANVGRPTGRSAAAERAGVELLMTMYCDLVGDPLPPERTQAYLGVKWIYIRRDLQACARLILTRDLGPVAILRSWTGPFSYALFAVRDPVPFLADLWGAGRRLARARRRPRLANRVGADPGRFDARSGATWGMAMAAAGSGLVTCAGRIAPLMFG